jgi:hypothetical protein
MPIVRCEADHDELNRWIAVYLREHLRVQVSIGPKHMYDDGNEVFVTLLLHNPTIDEEITMDHTTLPA